MNKPAANLTLTCRAECLADRVRLNYAVSSSRPEDIYVLDYVPAAPLGDVKARRMVPDFSHADLRPEGAAARLLCGIPPLPTDRLVNVRMFPLATKLEPGKTLERCIEFPLPLREQSPYDCGDKPPQYETVRISRLLLTVHVLSSAAFGVTVEPAAEPPDFWVVRAPNMVRQAEELAGQVELPGVDFLKIKDRGSWA